MDLSKYQKAIIKAFQNTTKNINISAVAGSGKTTMLLELLKLVPEDKTCLFLAFNNSIVNELKDRCEKMGVGDNVEIMTIHSCGWRAVRQRYGGRAHINKNKVIGKIDRFLSKDVSENQKYYYYYIINKIIDLMRCNLAENTDDGIMRIAEKYDLSIGATEIDLAKKVFKEAMKDRWHYDFADMIYFPVVNSGEIPLVKYDYIFCDESQDFSPVQHDFIKLCINRRGRLITVGDPRQAIYGFAGADEDSYYNLANINGESVRMPLSVSYRCGKNIVAEANSIVSDIKPFADAEDGIVRNGEITELQDGDWVLCRNLKPLVQTYLWLLKNKVKSKIRGREIGAGLISLINKTGVKTDLGKLMEALDREKGRVFSELKARGIHRPFYHPKYVDLENNVEVIACLKDEVQSVEKLKKMIADIFSDDVQGIILSTIHKAKGLENDRVFFVCPELIPSKYCTQDWQFEQEKNLKYVAITRAKSELVYVSTENFNKNILN